MRHPRGDARKPWTDTPARKAARAKLDSLDYSTPTRDFTKAWFRVYDMGGGYSDVPATLSLSSGYRMKNEAFRLYDQPGVKAVAVLNANKDAVIFSVRNIIKRSERRNDND